MAILLYTLAVIALGAGLTVFAYLDRVYRELGRVTTGRIHDNLEIFEAEIEPRLGMSRRRGVLELAISLAHISEEEEPGSAEAQQEGLEALVEAAQEEGILAQEQAQMIEQVVEFSDKRVREVMTPRPDIVAIPATATIEQLRRL